MFSPVYATHALGAQKVKGKPADLPPHCGLWLYSSQQVSLEAVLQLPSDTKHNLPFVITVEPSSEQAIREAVEQMNQLSFLREPPLALPMEPPL